LQVFVRDNNADQVLREKKMQREGVFREMKGRRSYEKSSEKSNREKAKHSAEPHKLARKKAEREGLIGAPRRRKVSPGKATGRGLFSVALGLNRDGSAAMGTRILRELRQWSSPLIAQAPKLKAFCVDCFLDRIARQVVGRSFVRCYCSGSSPGTVLARKLADVRVAGEGAQPVRSLRFENVDAHGDLISRYLDAASSKAGNV
jgi:small subunit ribosomal protein S21